MSYVILIYLVLALAAVARDLNHPLLHSASKVGVAIGEMVEQVVSTQGLLLKLIES